MATIDKSVDTWDSYVQIYQSICPMHVYHINNYGIHMGLNMSHTRLNQDSHGTHVGLMWDSSPVLVRLKFSHGKTEPMLGKTKTNAICSYIPEHIPGF